MELSSPRRSSLEKIIFVVLLIVIGALSGRAYMVEQKLIKQRQLSNELNLMRNAIHLYQMLKKKNPENILSLAFETYQMGPGKPRRFLPTLKIDDNQHPIDPFGNPYDYNPKKAWVKSTTHSFENW